MVTYHLLNSSVVVSYAGKLVNISSDDKRYEQILNLIREDKLDEIPDVVEAAERAFAGERTELKDGLVHVDGEPMPSELSDRIVRLKKQNLPFEPLLKFWDNLKQNPSFNSRKMLYAFLEHNGHPLTADGRFIAYRGVTTDFKDKHTGKFDNSPGAVCKMPRELVDDNPNQTCSSGLHVACYQYAKDFGPKLVEVMVNPRDVVCVPVDYNGTKMRVCEFEVVQECTAMRTEELYPSEEEIEDDCDGCGELVEDCVCDTEEEEYSDMD